MIKLLVFLGLSTVVWTLILLFIIRCSVKIGTQPSKVRSVVLMLSNGVIINLAILTGIYHIQTFHISLVIWIWIAPILIGDLYYDKMSRKENKERGKVLDEVIRSFENKCNKAGIESGLNTVKKNSLLTLGD